MVISIRGKNHFVSHNVQDNCQRQWGVRPIQSNSRRFLEPDLTVGAKIVANMTQTGLLIQWFADETALIVSTNVMPQMGQLPAVLCTTSGCIGQVYLTVWLPLAASSDVLQPVMPEIAAPSTSVISAILVQFNCFIVVSPNYFQPEMLPVPWGVTRSAAKPAVLRPVRSR